MAKKITRPLLALTCLILSFSLFSQSSGDIYILEKSIDVLTEPGNFRRDQTIAPSRNGQMTVLRRVREKDPRWWPEGVAIEILSINGQEQRPVKTVYVAKYWFDRGARKGELASLPNPIQLQEQVISALTPVIPECEIHVGEPELPSIPNRPADRDTYSTLSQLVQSTSSTRTCQNALRSWYKNNSMWKDLSRNERAKVIVSRANEISRQIRVNGLVDSCARATGLTSESDRREMRAFIQLNLSKAEQDRINFTNYGANCQRYISSINGGVITNSSYFSKRTNDPNSVHPQLDASLAICIIKREVSSTDFDPHSMNYSFCQSRGRQGRPRSTAHGLAQFTQTTFLSLRDSGLLPLSNTESTTNRTANRRIFREMSTDPDMQIESIFYYLNYLMKAPAAARIRHIHDQVYSDSFQDWEKAVISYDQDRASDYIRGVHSCRRCIGNAGDDSEAQARCLSGN